jgi:drug/metabolite transporter (DMT)-like permease
MPFLALVAVLLAAVTHATWNLAAKRAASSRHFVWMYSALSVVLYAPIVAFIVLSTRPVFGPIHWWVLAGTAALHIGYSLTLQAGYRVSDLSLVYPLARGSGPLLSFVLAVWLLGESVTWISVVGVALIVSGIVLVSGMLSREHRAPGAGILFGLGTGMFIASYTINDGYAHRHRRGELGVRALKRTLQRVFRDHGPIVVRVAAGDECVHHLRDHRQERERRLRVGRGLEHQARVLASHRQLP